MIEPATTPTWAGDRNLRAVLEEDRFTERVPDHFAYRGLADFVLREGQEFRPEPLPSKYSRMEMCRCFENAATLAAADEGLTYVEGIAWGKVPCPHAWCVDDKGSVIDPTWAAGDDWAQLRYFGVPFKTSFVLEMQQHGSSVITAGDGAMLRGIPRAQWHRVIPKFESTALNMDSDQILQSGIVVGDMQAILGAFANDAWFSRSAHEPIGTYELYKAITQTPKEKKAEVIVTLVAAGATASGKLLRVALSEGSVEAAAALLHVGVTEQSAREELHKFDCELEYAVSELSRSGSGYRGNFDSNMDKHHQKWEETLKASKDALPGIVAAIPRPFSFLDEIKTRRTLMAIDEARLRGETFGTPSRPDMPPVVAVSGTSSRARSR